MQCLHYEDAAFFYLRLVVALQGEKIDIRLMDIKEKFSFSFQKLIV